MLSLAYWCLISVLHQQDLTSGLGSALCQLLKQVWCKMESPDNQSRDQVRAKQRAYQGLVHMTGLLVAHILFSFCVGGS